MTLRHHVTRKSYLAHLVSRSYCGVYGTASDLDEVIIFVRWA